MKKNFSHAVRPRAKINNFIKVPFGGAFSVCFSLFFFMREMMQRERERQGGEGGSSGMGGSVGDGTEAPATHWAYTRHGVGGNVWTNCSWEGGEELALATAAEGGSCALSGPGPRQGPLLARVHCGPVTYYSYYSMCRNVAPSAA